jgi:hypothetical protein
MGLNYTMLETLKDVSEDNGRKRRLLEVTLLDWQLDRGQAEQV